MNDINKQQKIIEYANYFVDTQCTVRKVAQKFNISKSTIYIQFTEFLPEIDRDLYLKVRKVLDKNKSERHIRGGISTKKKYSKKV